MLPDTSVVIPTYNRPNELAKLLKFVGNNFKLSKIHVYVLDGSNTLFAEKNEQLCKDMSLNYHHYGADITYYQRILDGLSKVGTDTVTLHGDDDVLNQDGFVEAVCFLNDNPDYAIAHGQYIGFDFTANGVVSSKTYESYSVEHDTPFARMFAFFSSYTAPTFYAVNRTEYLKKAFEELVANDTTFKDYFSAEILVSAIPLLYGKMKRLNSFFQARRFVPPPKDKFIVYPKYILDEGFSQRYNLIKKSIIKNVRLDDIEDLEKISDALDYSFAAFLGQRISTEEMHTRFQALNLGRF